jgi:hypothetical protein
MPLADLAVVAVSEALVYPVLMVAVLIPVAVLVRGRLLSGLELSPGTVGWAVLGIALAAAWAIWAGRVTSIIGFVALVGGAVAEFALIWVMFGPPYPVGLVRAAAATGALALYAGVVSGLAPNHAGTIVADLVTTDDAKFPSGRYIILGELDDTLWLLPCIDQSSAIQVPSDAVATRRVVDVGEAHPGRLSPDLNNIVPDPPGFTPRCEPPTEAN